jgi:hypothetical protein
VVTRESSTSAAPKGWVNVNAPIPAVEAVNGGRRYRCCAADEEHQNEVDAVRCSPSGRLAFSPRRARSELMRPDARRGYRARSPNRAPQKAESSSSFVADVVSHRCVQRSTPPNRRLYCSP